MNKNIMTKLTIHLKNGRTEQVDLQDLEAFIARNTGNIQYEQSDLPVEGRYTFLRRSQNNEQAKLH
jgi:hypothetical protein